MKRRLSQQLRPEQLVLGTISTLKWDWRKERQLVANEDKGSND